MKAFILFCSLTCSCAAIGKDADLIRQHPVYNKLTFYEQYVAESIMKKAVLSKQRDYYFKKLALLLSTETVQGQVIASLNNQEIKESVDYIAATYEAFMKDKSFDLSSYTNTEEAYESLSSRKWQAYCPREITKCFYVANDDANDLLAYVQVKLNGEFQEVSDVMFLEDAIEKHLSIPGFNVNLVFVGYEADDVFSVVVDPNTWPHSENWASGHAALAHELLHLMGLPDEYDRIENHADNKFMDRTQRLIQFLIQMDNPTPKDAVYGIMMRHSRQPLERHVCAAVGLGKECTEERNQRYKRK